MHDNNIHRTTTTTIFKIKITDNSSSSNIVKWRIKY